MLFRDALVFYIMRADPAAEVILAKDLHEAMAFMAQNPAQDLILLDLRMPGMNGLDGVRQMRQLYPTIPLALMSGVAEPEDVKEAMRLGAVGYFPKTLSGKELLKAIQTVLGGQSFVPVDPAQTNRIMPSYYADTQADIGLPIEKTPHRATSANNEEDFSLTPREKDVLSHLARGETNKDIAQALGLQIVTVKLHVRGICRKMNAQNRTQAALIAQESRLFG